MNTSTETVSPDTSAEIDYEVERIDDKRVFNGVIQYFIKWKNYSSAENTWEPLGNLSCEELIQEYEVTHPDIESLHSLAPKPKQIMGKRISGSSMEYLVKWSDQSQSWMTSTDGTLLELISKFEEKQLKRKRPTQPKANKQTLKPKKNVEGNDLMKPPIGFTQSKMTNFVFTGENVDCIIDMKRIKGEVKYLVTYKNSTADEWVPMDTVKRTIPHKVIKFYEACITWE